jgi:hypothetical protein
MPKDEKYLAELLAGLSSANGLLALIEAGKLSREDIAPLVARLSLPPYDAPHEALVLNLRLGLGDGFTFRREEVGRAEGVGRNGPISAQGVARLEQNGIRWLADMVRERPDSLSQVMAIIPRSYYWAKIEYALRYQQVKNLREALDLAKLVLRRGQVANFGRRSAAQLVRAARIWKIAKQSQRKANIGE